MYVYNKIKRSDSLHKIFEVDYSKRHKKQLEQTPSNLQRVHEVLEGLRVLGYTPKVYTQFMLGISSVWSSLYDLQPTFTGDMTPFNHGHGHRFLWPILSASKGAPPTPPRRAGSDSPLQNVGDLLIVKIGPLLESGCYCSHLLFEGIFSAALCGFLRWQLQVKLRPQRNIWKS